MRETWEKRELFSFSIIPVVRPRGLRRCKALVVSMEVDSLLLCPSKDLFPQMHIRGRAALQQCVCVWMAWLASREGQKSFLNGLLFGQVLVVTLVLIAWLRIALFDAVKRGSLTSFLNLK